MAELIYEFPENAHLWARQVFAHLESSMEAGRRSNTAIVWEEPTDATWSILMAHVIANSDIDWKEMLQPKSISAAIMEQFMLTLVRWLRSIQDPEDADPTTQLLQLSLIQQVSLLYSKLHHHGLHRTEGNLLHVLFSNRYPIAIQLGVDLLISKPPSNWTDISFALTPLMQSKTWNVEDLFPKLLQTADPAVLAPALDVANHCFLERRLTTHPASTDYDRLLNLLGGLANQLQMLEENPRRFGNSVQTIQKILFDSVSLAVSLCHTLGLMGRPDAIGKLNQAIGLSHRRIQTEAAYALAKLGDTNGRKKLLDLAADFTCRQRVLAYAEELGMEDQIDERYTSSASVAESRLANWLAQNDQMGIAPIRMELLDQRTLSWPGYEQPQECFLFRFEYDLQNCVYSNLGIAGPMCNSFSDDLANISMDDAFAMFVGWDIDHPDVYETPIDALLSQQRGLVENWLQAIDGRFDAIEILFFGVFLEHQAILARGTKGTETRVFVYDGDRFVFEPFPKSNEGDPRLTYWMWRGRLFLEANP